MCNPMRKAERGDATRLDTMFGLERAGGETRRGDARLERAPEEVGGARARPEGAGGEFFIQRRRLETLEAFCLGRHAKS